jgi:hypothetical protein
VFGQEKALYSVAKLTALWIPAWPWSNAGFAYIKVAG